MNTILSIDTSTKACSVAIHQNNNLLAVIELLHEKSSSGMLTTMIQDAVKYAQLTLNDIDAFAIAKGPGSYTGLRIGVSTAKGLCFTLDKPLIAINTLEAMAWQLSDFEINHTAKTLLCPLLDARRMEVYCAIYRNTEPQGVKMEDVLHTQAKIIDENSFADLLADNKIVFFGDGADKCKAVIKHPNAIFPYNPIYPSARTIGLLATQAFENEAFEDVADFEPFYLKDFVTTTPRQPAW